MNKQISTFWAVFIIVVLACLVIGLIFLNQKMNEDNLSAVPKKDVQNIDQSQTADWKTYKNNEYGFEFQYPSGWFQDSAKLAELTGGIVAIYNEKDFGASEFVMSVHVMSVNDNLKYTLDYFVSSFKKGIKDYQEIDNQNLKIDGQDARLIESSSSNEKGEQQTALILYVIKDGKFYDFGAMSDTKGMEKYKNIIKQSLLTFKFTK